MYLECREGGSAKFWSVKLEGKALHLRWGRIGTDGQQQVKQFASVEKAKAELARLLAEKKGKGYVTAKPQAPGTGAAKARTSAVPPKKPARGTSSSSAPGAGSHELKELCSAIEAFCSKLETVEGLEVQPMQLAPRKASDIAAFEKKFSVTLPDDVRAFLQRGLRYVEGSVRGDDYAHIGFDFISMKSMEKTMQIFRDLVDHYEEQDDDDSEEKLDLMQHGVALSYSEPSLVVHCGPGPDTGAIFHFSTRNPLLPPVAPSLTEFLRHWLAAGCFGSHDFMALWPKVEALVPVKIPRKKNRWLRYYDAQFRTKYAR
jgi:predicted DNA-binding WGR domain protein